MKKQYVVNVVGDCFEKNVEFSKRIQALKYAQSYAGVTKALQTVKVITYRNTQKESERLIYGRGVTND